MTDPSSSERYTLISSDTHAGGSHADYRDYLDAKYLDEFDAWRGKYRNPFNDLGDARRLRNWDDDMRNSQQDADGVVGEVIFPNTVPPFFPTFVLFALPPKPAQYELRHAGIQAHNRWLVDFCGRFPKRRAGIGQIFLNDLDDAIADVHFIAENNLRGGVLLPAVAPDVDWITPIFDRSYDRLWAVCQDLDVPINIHGGSGVPSYGKDPAGMLYMLSEVAYFSRRPFILMLLSGVFERFPRLEVVLTEQGTGWLPGVLSHLDRMITQVRDNHAVGELRFGDDVILPRTATEYLQQNVWFGASFPKRGDIEAVRSTVGIDRLMWGSDYPHDEGTYPFTTEALRQVFFDWDPIDVRKVTSENVAALYGFDLAALKLEGDRLGPLVADVAKPLVELPDGANEALLANT